MLLIGIAIFLLILFAGIPVCLTIINIIYLFKKQRKSEMVTDIFTMVLGVIYSLLLFDTLHFPEWNVPLVIGGDVINIHTPLSYEHVPTFLAFWIAALLGYGILRIKKTKLPPLISCVCISGIFIGFIMASIWTVQLFKNTGDFLVIFLWIFPLNYVFCAVRLLREVITEYVRNLEENRVDYKNKILRFCMRSLSKASGWFLIPLIVMIPVICILLDILILFGQAPDAVIKVFTQTSDWTLSKMVSPPPVAYQGHYLCTVAANGSKDLVKPLRMGKRYGYKIIINRQLCVANAFEDLMQEKVPALHKVIRGFYDRHGYPLATKITAKWKSNVVYVLMKPLEWLFLLVLYTMDLKPENRISRQYTR